MGTRSFISLSLLTVFLLTVSCRRERLLQMTVTADDAQPGIGLSVEFPEMTPVKGTVGNLPASDAENAIHSLSIWVFESEAENHPLVASMDIPREEFPVSGGVRRYTIPLVTSRDFANRRPAVDVFILVNAAAIGSPLKVTRGEGETPFTWEDLNNAHFGDPYFGIDAPVTSVGENGLPMSGVGKGLEVQGDEPLLRVETVQVRRAVSKLRFIFCKTKTEGGEDDEVSIDNIVLYGSQIPLKEYVFAAGESNLVLDQPVLLDNYVAGSYIISWPSGVALAENETPENLIYVNQSPAVYEQLIDDASSQSTVTNLGYTYFRESDKRLVGQVQYKVNGDTRVRDFSMRDAGDFARNHTWTLFGYFLSGRNLQLSVSVQPWDYNEYTVDFSEQSITVTSKFVVDDTSADVTETSKDHYDVRIPSGKAAKGRLYITTPVGGRLMIKPATGNASAFLVTPEIAQIDPNTNAGRIDIEIRRNPKAQGDLTGQYLTLSFSVEASGREMNADSEVVDAVYRFIL